MWQHLPFELKVLILSHMPLSNHKLSLRIISKEWSDLLGWPDSHTVHQGQSLGVSQASSAAQCLRQLTKLFNSHVLTDAKK